MKKDMHTFNNYKAPRRSKDSGFGGARFQNLRYDAMGMVRANNNDSLNCRLNLGLLETKGIDPDNYDEHFIMDSRDPEQFNYYR